MFTQCCKAGMNHSLFVVSHKESPGKWDATSDTGLVSEIFVGGFKCLGKTSNEVLWRKNISVMWRDSGSLVWL